MSLAASPGMGQASGRWLGFCREFCILCSSGLAALQGGVSFSRLCRKFAQETKGSHRVRVQLTLQPLHPEVSGTSRREQSCRSSGISRL